MPHKKHHLVKPTVLTKTRYIGFARTPVRDNDESALISGLPEPTSDYELPKRPWVDMNKGR